MGFTENTVIEMNRYKSILRAQADGVVRCVDCGGSLSFRGEVPFCRSCKVFNTRSPGTRQELARGQHMNHQEIRDYLEKEVKYVGVSKSIEWEKTQ